MGRPRQIPHKKFASSIIKHPNGGCWEWIGTKGPRGYGVFCTGNSYKPEEYFRSSAHRASWMMRYGAIPDGLFVLHRCNNPSCVNTEHLYLGDHKRNMQDRKEAGNYLQGEAHFNSTYTEVQVREIYDSEGGEWDVAKRLGVSRYQVNRIRSGKSWKHLFGGKPSPFHGSGLKSFRKP